MPIVALALALAGLVLLRPLLRVAIALVAGRSIGRRVLEAQPDRIELREAGQQAWQDPAAAYRMTEPLLLLGYESAGTFTVPQLPGVVLRLLVQAREGVLGIVYEHPRAGHWAELVTRYAGGTAFTVSSSADRGLAPRPGHPVTHLPGAASAVLHSRLLLLRPRGGMERIEAARAVEAVAQAWTEGVAWRKANGISRGEVVRVAARGVTKQKAA